MSDMQDLIDEMLKSVKYLIEQAMGQTTKTYDGLIVGIGESGKPKVQFNGEVYEVSQYGGGTPTTGSMVKVIVPQGNMNLAFFFIGGAGGGSVATQVLSWNGRTGAVVPEQDDYDYTQISGLVDELNKKIAKAVVVSETEPESKKVFWVQALPRCKMYWNKESTDKVYWNSDTGCVPLWNDSENTPKAMRSMARQGPMPRETVVTSWKGRIGQVAPNNGDYDYTQIRGLTEQLDSKLIEPVVIGNTPPESIYSVWVDTSDGIPASLDAQTMQTESPTNEPNSTEVVQSTTGVLSWNGRTGHVYPKFGDYNYKQVAGLEEELNKRPEFVYIQSDTAPENKKALWIDTSV